MGNFLRHFEPTPWAGPLGSFGGGEKYGIRSSEYLIERDLPMDFVVKRRVARWRALGEATVNAYGFPYIRSFLF